MPDARIAELFKSPFLRAAQIDFEGIAGHPQFVVVRSCSLIAEDGEWSEVPNSQNPMTIEPEGSSQFYRLRK